MPLDPEPRPLPPSAHAALLKLLRRRSLIPPALTTPHKTDTHTLSEWGEWVGGEMNFKRLLKQKKENEGCTRLRYLK